ncbi:MAG: hypothetical protein OZX49_01081 [Immundisolibacter sp.]|nr:hypothetical protein [Immundisolibacter sp.]
MITLKPYWLSGRCCGCPSGTTGALPAHRPAWLDSVLARATAVQATDRYAHVADVVADLEHGLSGGAGTAPQRPQPLYARNPLRFWQGLCALLAIALLVLLARA